MNRYEFVTTESGATYVTQCGLPIRQTTDVENYLLDQLAKSNNEIEKLRDALNKINDISHFQEQAI